MNDFKKELLETSEAVINKQKKEYEDIKQQKINKLADNAKKHISWLCDNYKDELKMVSEEGRKYWQQKLCGESKKNLEELEEEYKLFFKDKYNYDEYIDGCTTYSSRETKFAGHGGDINNYHYLVVEKNQLELLDKLIFESDEFKKLKKLFEENDLPLKADVEEEEEIDIENSGDWGPSFRNTGKYIYRLSCSW